MPNTPEPVKRTLLKIGAHHRSRNGAIDLARFNYLGMTTRIRRVLGDDPWASGRGIG
jgi:hypothetical protein